MASKGKTKKRTLVVTGQKPIATVGNHSGGQSTLYEVYATTPEGEPVEEPLRAFTELEEGVAIEYSVERYNHPQYGTSYTLTPPPRNTARRVRVLEEQMEHVLWWAEKQGFDLKKAKREKRVEEANSMEPTEPPDRPDLDEKYGEKAPWEDEDLERKPSEPAGNSSSEVEKPADLDLGGD